MVVYKAKTKTETHASGTSPSRVQLLYSPSCVDHTSSGGYTATFTKEETSTRTLKEVVPVLMISEKIKKITDGNAKMTSTKTPKQNGNPFHIIQKYKNYGEREVS